MRAQECLVYADSARRSSPDITQFHIAAAQSYALVAIAQILLGIDRDIRTDQFASS
jgi:hypothetical protein